MPVKKRHAKARAYRITDEVVELWIRGNRMLADLVDGELSEEFIELCSRFDLALGVRPWMESPFDVVSKGDPPSWMTGSHAHRADAYREAQALRQALEEAAKR